MSRAASSTPAPSVSPEVAQAYQQALAARAARLSAGGRPRGYKVGFTNRNIWPRYGVFAPIWGTVWADTLAHCDGEGVISLAGLAEATVALACGTGAQARVVESGAGANVLDGPLHVLRHFLAELRACPGAPDLQPGDVVTTGTWTDAWAVTPGERWQAHFSAPLAPLAVSFT